MKEILNKKLGPEDPLEWDSKNDWTIGECLSTWWRPNYENYMVNTFLFIEYNNNDFYITVSIRSSACHQSKRKKVSLYRSFTAKQ